MWKFIVTWCLLNEIMIPNSPTKDKFGRESQSVTLEYRYRIEQDCGHSKEFMCRQKAYEFYNEAYSMQPDTIRFNNDTTYYVIERGGMLSGVKIDSVYIECGE